VPQEAGVIVFSLFGRNMKSSRFRDVEILWVKIYLQHGRLSSFSRTVSSRADGPSFAKHGGALPIEWANADAT
jgi:hypothetical protein